MKKINLQCIFPLLALIVLIFGLSGQMFRVAPLGKLLDPFAGAVQNGSETDIGATLTIKDMGLSGAVQVFYDTRKVPHIYAANEKDLYFAQGYITARLRLWQMDFLSYTAAGRLSEIFTTGFEDFDRTQRRMGILDGAKRSLQLMESDPETNTALTAYTRGINSYIQGLNYRDLPFEYKLLDYGPEPWTKLKTVLIMKYMAKTLTGHEEDFGMSNMMLCLGEKKFNQLFPDFTSHITPVVNEPLSPGNPDPPFIKKPDYLDYSFMTADPTVAEDVYNPKLGSNSWAVSGKKTRSGFPILCNDPHLNLSLPSIWLEMQLSSPEMNVYGVSIPGTPAIIIGFNDEIAWGTTNGEDDVKDWYKLRITNDYKKYEWDGQWKNLDLSVEEIRRRGQRSLYDTIYHAIQGPIVFDRRFPGPKKAVVNYALRWELQKASNEFLAFIRLNKAHNYQQYKEAISHYSCPIQNFTFACKDGTIAVNHQGNMAIKQPGEGKFVLDGSSSSYLYTKYIPQDSLPHLVNPSCNYVLSANQHPTGPDYKYYYNGYFSETRAGRIRQILERENGFDIEKMEAMQLDNVNSLAVEVLPVLLRNIPAEKLGPAQQEDLGSLRSWKGDYGIDDEHAELFELWWNHVRDLSWKKLRSLPFYSGPPDDYVLLDLIRSDPGNDCFDVAGSSIKENAGDIILAAFTSASAEFDALRKKGSVRWGDMHKVNINHMTNITALSRLAMPSAGYPEAINAISSNWGPSWRMIVELGQRPRAFGIYAGGQSGNMGSPYYDNFINDWNKGNYYAMTFFMSRAEAAAHATNTWTLQ